VIISKTETIVDKSYTEKIGINSYKKRVYFVTRYWFLFIPVYSNWRLEQVQGV